MNDIDKLHYCTTEDSFEKLKKKVEDRWKKYNIIICVYNALRKNKFLF